ncbi:hypothetical protein AB4Z45_08665 [Paenibacillus sp. MCAF9]|uniref:hypothetical protein n=1 Tax=Paenibacillus sp. MCAF9 TaxID=3233046 RepID=UPI003F9B3F80
MNGYKHYIRTNEAGMIIHGFSSAFEQPLETDYLFAEEASRHFHESFTEPLTNERGQYRFKVIDAEFVARSQEELDAEWQLRPLTPLSELDLLKLENTELKIALAELAEAQEADKTDMQLALAELADLLLGGE